MIPQLFAESFDYTGGNLSIRVVDDAGTIYAFQDGSKSKLIGGPSLVSANFLEICFAAILEAMAANFGGIPGVCAGAAAQRLRISIPISFGAQ